MSEPFGLVNLNKPAGWTSRKAVDHVKRLVKPAKIGHAGTLDPIATGVLVLCIGPATRLVPYLHDLQKEYRAEFLLGRRSPSDDIETEIEVVDEQPTLTLAEIEVALPSFIGQIQQIPPVYSAVKIHGQRAYELARRGKSPEIKPKTVEVFSIEIVEYAPPVLTLDIVCGSGTYIRSLGRDLAQSLGTTAVMSGLERTRIGPFRIEDSSLPEDVTTDSLPSRLLPAQTGLVDLTLIAADEPMLERLQRGLECELPKGIEVLPETLSAVVSQTGQLMLLANVTERSTLKPKQVFFPKRGKLGED